MSDTYGALPRNPLTEICPRGYVLRAMLPARWNPRRFGSVDDPIHKSHLNTLTGDHGCPKRFWYERTAGPERASRGTVSASLACGSAVHETIARALSNPELCARILHGGGVVSRARVRATFWEELERDLGGRMIEWGRTTDDDYVSMVHGALDQLHQHVAAVVQLEGGFTVQLGDLHFAGHVDLIYRPRAAPHALALADWKTGKTKPDPIELDHGWESGVYSAALRWGTFLGREHVALSRCDDGQWQGLCHGRAVTAPTRWQAERDALEAGLDELARGRSHAHAVQHGEFPHEIRHVHLRDYVPYLKAGSKEVKRAEDIVHYQLSGPGRVRYVAGQHRGPAWIPVARTEHDVPRLKHRLRTVVGTVRMGRFLDLVGERCNRCPYAQRCLTDGYAPEGAELDTVTAAFREAGLDPFC